MQFMQVGEKTKARGICGKDLNKKGTPAGEIPVPESGGLAVGCVFLLCVICFELVHYYDISSLLRWVAGGFSGRPELEPIADAWLVDYNAALATIGFMMFLGFADDVLDIRWRVKLILPLFAAMPLLVAYSGGTGIAVPKPLQAWLGLPGYMELGPLYLVYIAMLAIFSTNSINILAGVNGLEAGQTFIIACAMLTHNLFSILGSAGGVPHLRDGHLFSAYLSMPLAACTMGLLVHNW
jgi:UDP-N-acetylglucosamine--dolichyl-phosphate N-acetylglucosaminephosphotransferase